MFNKAKNQNRRKEVQQDNGHLVRLVVDELIINNRKQAT